MPETWVGSLGWEDPLEEGTTTPSSVLAWRIPMEEEPGGLQFMGSQRVGHHQATEQPSALGGPGITVPGATYAVSLLMDLSRVASAHLWFVWDGTGSSGASHVAQFASTVPPSIP